MHYGDPNMEMQRDNPERREAFLTRHSCDTKKDPFAPGFWACYDWENTDEKSADMKSITRPLKVVDSTDDTLTVEMYVAVFGDENHRDIDGEWFHPGTSLKSSYTDVNAVAVDWEHGQSPDFDEETGQRVEQPGRDDIVGTLDYLTSRTDNIGILARAALNRRDWYVREFIEPMIRIGMVGGSSEAIPGKVVKNAGRIDVWPLKRYALTLTPADTRQVTAHQVYQVKSLAKESQAFKSIASQYPILKALTEDGNNYTINVFTSESKDADNEPDKQPDESTTEPATTHEGEVLQTDGATVTATPENDADKEGLTPEQEIILLEQIDLLLHTLEEIEL